MKILINIPHIFAPKKNSQYSSGKLDKKELKELALKEATIGNIARHCRSNWIHASLGKGKKVVNRKLETNNGVEMTINVYTNSQYSLANILPKTSNINIKNIETEDLTSIPMLASQNVLENAENFDVVGYMEDDLAIYDRDFFSKIVYIDKIVNDSYAFIPHRCETIDNYEDVILSGDPDGGRSDLFWDTGENISIPWIDKNIKFYRATNPHSGCYFLTSRQARIVRNHWLSKNWRPDFQLSGPLEQAGSGMLLPAVKIMKPVPNDYRFLMINHLDCLWKNHSFEQNTMDK